jgi:small subunit ribosomal protein S24e
MDVNIKSKTEKPLLSRTDVQARVAYEGATPKREALRDSLASALKKPADQVIVRRITTEFGKQAVQVEASVYESKEMIEKFEPQHMKKRHGLVEEAK